MEYRLAFLPLDPRGRKSSEQLSVFAAVRDEDGIKDLAALHILHDGSEYIWTLRPETWARKERNKETWVGATGLVSPDSGPLPRGLYRVVLEDLSGESDETSFTLGAGLGEELSFPSITREGDDVAVSSRYSRTELLFLDSRGTLVRVVEAPREARSLDSLYGSRDWRSDVQSLTAYAYDPERNVGLFSWAVKVVE